MLMSVVAQRSVLMAASGASVVRSVAPVPIGTATWITLQYTAVPPLNTAQSMVPWAGVAPVVTASGAGSVANAYVSRVVASDTAVPPLRPDHFRAPACPGLLLESDQDHVAGTDEMCRRRASVRA
jgi:hypothetical protein